jgi:tetratricopeptide (TPR) repeat protein
MNCVLATCCYFGKKQDFAASIEQAKILCDRFPDNLSYRAQMAIEMMQNGDYEQAIDIFDSVLAIAPKDPNTLTSKAHALKTFGNNEAAIQNYQAAYESKPDHGEAYFSLANLKTYTFTSQEVASYGSANRSPRITAKRQSLFSFRNGACLRKRKTL